MPWLTKMNLQTKPVGKGEKKILKALKDGKFQKFTELTEAADLSAVSLTDNLKSLQKRKFVKKDIDSRKYGLDSEGFRWLKTENLVDTIKEGTLSEQESSSPPVDSIVAIDIPNMPEAQRRVFMAGTPDIAKACFNQFLADTVKAKGSEDYPVAGRIVYTAAIDWRLVRPWLDSKEGKKYLKFWLKETEP